MWGLVVGLLFIAGCGVEETVAEAGKRRLPKPEWADRQLGDDIDVATYQIWISQDGDVSAGSSWSTGEVPGAWGATDIVLVDGVASQVSMTSGLDQSAITIGRMDVTDNFKGDLGLPGTPLQWAAVSPLVMRGSGTLHYRSSGASALFVDSPNLLDAVSLPNCNIAGLFVSQGHVHVGAGSAFSAISVLTTFGTYAKVTLEGSSDNGPAYTRVYDGTIDLGHHGPKNTAVQPSIDVAGGLLKLHRLTGGLSYAWLRQTGGMIDFDMAASDGADPVMILAGGVADFRKCQYAFGDLSAWLSYIAPGMQIIPGPVMTEAAWVATNILDFRKEYP